MKITRLLIAMLIVPFALTGCGEKEPTLGDEVGQSVDKAADEGGKAMDDAKDALKDATK
jgi:predicted small lipoprotein YifL